MDPRERLILHKIQEFNKMASCIKPHVHPPVKGVCACGKRISENKTQCLRCKKLAMVCEAVMADPDAREAVEALFKLDPDKGLFTDGER